MISRGTIIAIRLDEQIITAKVTKAKNGSLTARAFANGQPNVRIGNYLHARYSGRIVVKGAAEILARPKTVVHCEILMYNPTWLQKIFGKCKGYKYSLHKSQKRLTRDNFGLPRIKSCWCRKIKVTGTLFTDGFFTPDFKQRYKHPIYFDQYNGQKNELWKKRSW